MTPSSPARLEIAGPENAVVHVDGTEVERLPSAEPVELPSGEHLVAVTLDGHEPVARTIVARRGEATKVDVALDITDQRLAADVLLGVGAVGIATGIAFGVVAVVEQRRSSSILDDAGGFANLAPSQLEDYETAIARKDDFRTVSGVVVGSAMSVFVVGGMLFVFDEAEAPEDANDDGRFEILPSAGPDGAGLTTTVRF